MIAIVRRVNTLPAKPTVIHRATAEAATAHGDARAARDRTALKAQMRDDWLGIESEILVPFAVLLRVVCDTHSRNPGAPARSQVDDKIVKTRIISGIRTNADSNLPVRFWAPAEQCQAVHELDGAALDAQTAGIILDQHGAQTARRVQVLGRPQERSVVQDLRRAVLCKETDDQPGARAVLVNGYGRQRAHRDAEATAVPRSDEVESDAEEGQGVKPTARCVDERAAVVK